MTIWCSPVHASPRRLTADPLAPLRACDFFDRSCFLHIQPVVFTPPTNRHPERSAPQMGRMTQRLWRGVEGPRGYLSGRYCSRLFNHRSPRLADGPWCSSGDLVRSRAWVVEKLRTASTG